MINLASICVMVTIVTVCSGSAIPMWEFLARTEKVRRKLNSINTTKTNEKNPTKFNLSSKFHINAVIYYCQFICCCSAFLYADGVNIL